MEGLFTRLAVHRYSSTRGLSLTARRLTEVAVPAETHMERQSLDRAAVLQLVKEQLADIMESDIDAIGEDDRFAEDLHADSLALVELVEVLEDELAERSCAVLFDDEDLVDLLTVRDAVDYVMARIGS